LLLLIGVIIIVVINSAFYSSVTVDAVYSCSASFDVFSAAAATQH